MQNKFARERVVAVHMAPVHVDRGELGTSTSQCTVYCIRLSLIKSGIVHFVYKTNTAVQFVVIYDGAGVNGRKNPLFSGKRQNYLKKNYTVFQKQQKKRFICRSHLHHRSDLMWYLIISTGWVEDGWCYFWTQIKQLLQIHMGLSDVKFFLMSSSSCSMC